MRTAQRISRTRAPRIAVVINLDWTLKHHHQAFAGTQEFALKKGWESVLWPFAPELVDERGRRLYDGIIARVHPELEESAAQAGIPLVNVWVSGPCPEVPAVLPDVEEAGRLVGTHLHARGFRHFGYVGYSRTTSSQLVHAGLRQVAKTQGLPLSNLLVSSSFSDSTRT